MTNHSLTAGTVRIRKPASTRKSEILRAAVRLASAVGPDRLTTASIAEEVGITQPAVFRHFPSKQALWEAIVGHIAAEMGLRWDESLRLEAPALLRLRRLVDAQLRLINSTPAIPAILFSRELHAGNPALRQSLFGLMRRFHGLLAGLLTEARQSGELRDGLAPEDVALLVLALIQGLALRWSLSGRQFVLHEEGARLLEIQIGGFMRPQTAAPSKTRRR